MLQQVDSDRLEELGGKPFARHRKFSHVNKRRIPSDRRDRLHTCFEFTSLFKINFLESNIGSRVVRKIVGGTTVR